MTRWARGTTGARGSWKATNGLWVPDTSSTSLHIIGVILWRKTTSTYTGTRLADSRGPRSSRAPWLSWWARWTISAWNSRRTRVSFGALADYSRSFWRWCCCLWTHWTAFSKRNLWVGAVQLLIITDDVIAENRSRVAHADLAWLWFPNIPVSISLPKMGTSCDDLLCQNN